MEPLHGDAASQPVEVTTLDFIDVLEFAATCLAEDPRIMATVLRRERKPEVTTWLVTQAFTDEKHELIRRPAPAPAGLTGRQLLVQALDDELTDLFGAAESITIELP
jgi:hypothetical protein